MIITRQGEETAEARGSKLPKPSSLHSRFTFHVSRNTQHVSPTGRSSFAFTLLEVMIACGIFFVATFAILGLVSNTLRNARSLQRIQVDAGMAAAQVFQTMKTNRQAEVSLSGDFGDSYPDYSWTADSQQFETNGLLQVDIIVNRRGLNKPFDTLSILVFSPDAKSTFGSPTFR